jgi:hypothetical protein
MLVNNQDRKFGFVCCKPKYGLNPGRSVMKITMDMSSYEIEQDEARPLEYGGEKMNTVWNSALELAGLQEIESTADVTPAVVSAIVLDKMYSCRQ